MGRRVLAAVQAAEDSDEVRRHACVLVRIDNRALLLRVGARADALPAVPSPPCAQEEAGGSDDEAAYDREVVRAHGQTRQRGGKAPFLRLPR
jgi:hypothetical protein